jgi:hypothetical protein
MCHWDNFLGDLFSSSDDDDGTQGRDEDQPPLADDASPYKYSTGQSLEMNQSPEKPDNLPDQSQYDVVSIAKLDDGDIYKVDTVNKRKVLFIDPKNAGAARQSDAKAAIRDGKEKTGGLSPPESHPLIAAYRGGGEEYMDSLEEFYNRKVPPRFVEMIKDAALLRYAEAYDSLSLLDVRERKAEMTKYGDEALNVASFCSSGFFDIDGLFQEKYRERVLDDSDTEDDYRDTFIRVVRAAPFVVFVKSDQQSAYYSGENLEPHKQVYDDAFQKSRYIDEYTWNFEYMQVRGTGPSAHPIVRETCRYFREHHEDLDNSLEEESRDLVFKFDPDTL